MKQTIIEKFNICSKKTPFLSFLFGKILSATPHTFYLNFLHRIGLILPNWWYGWYRFMISMNTWTGTKWECVSPFALCFHIQISKALHSCWQLRGSGVRAGPFSMSYSWNQIRWFSWEVFPFLTEYCPRYLNSKRYALVMIEIQRTVWRLWPLFQIEIDTGLQTERL